MTLEHRSGRWRAVVAILLAALIGAAGYSVWRQSSSRSQQQEADREAALRTALGELRDGIRRFHSDHGRYPRTLDELVPAFLDEIPADPMTGSASTWKTVTEETVVPRSDFAAEEAPPEVYVIDVRSGAGPPWSEL